MMKARAAHLDLAARHLDAARELGSVEGKSSKEDIGVSLQAAYQPPTNDEEGARLLDLLGKH